MGLCKLKCSFWVHMKFFNEIYKYLILYFFITAINPASAKVLIEKYRNTDSYTIKIEGYINKNDVTEFQNFIKKIQKENLRLHLNTIQLNSIGGNPFAGMRIGEIIRKNRLTTYVAPDAKCFSSCTFIFVAGVQRYAFGELGVHQMVIVEGKEFTFEEAEVAYVRYNKDFNNYFEKMRVSANIAKLSYDTPFWDFKILTEKEKFDWYINGTDIVETAVLVKEHAKKKNIDREEFEIIFADNYRACFEKMKNLEMTVWDCAAEKELLDQWDRIYYGTLVRVKRFISILKNYIEQIKDN
jgi:hypothetical protein